MFVGQVFKFRLKDASLNVLSYKAAYPLINLLNNLNCDEYFNACIAETEELVIQQLKQIIVRKISIGSASPFFKIDFSHFEFMASIQETTNTNEFWMPGKSNQYHWHTLN